jgi:hypothetical protein
MDATHNHGNADDMGAVAQTFSMALKQYASHSVKDLLQMVRDLEMQIKNIQQLQKENCDRLQQHAQDIDKNLHSIDKNRIGLKRNRTHIDSVRKKKRPREIARIVSEAIQNSAHGIALAFDIVPQNTGNPHTPQQTQMTMLRTSNTIDRLDAEHDHDQDHDEQAAHYDMQDIDTFVHALQFEPLPLSHDPSQATSPSQHGSTSLQASTAMQAPPSPYKKPQGKHPNCPIHNRRALWETSAHNLRKGLFKCPNGCRRNSLKIWSHSSTTTTA